MPGCRITIAIPADLSQTRSIRGGDSRLLIFAKAPQPGRVKTRLIPSLSPEDAALLHRELLLDTLSRLAAEKLLPVELWCAPHPGFPIFEELAKTYGLTLHRQCGSDLGERMYRASIEAPCSKMLLVGTDCPCLDRDYLAAALAALETHDAVLGPAEDGGYVLLGLKEVSAELFKEMPWGSDAVARLTRERMTALGWNWVELPALWDLDRPEDLERYRAT